MFLFLLEFMKMGLRGITVLFASGDQGIGSAVYMTPSPSGNSDEAEIGCSKAWPEWPASSPYVTSVGGTQLSNAYLPVCQAKYYDAVGVENGLDDAATNIVRCDGMWWLKLSNL